LDEAEAVKWYRRAAEQGYAKAQVEMSLRSANGWGVERSYPEALKWLTAAAENAYPPAQNLLGVAYDAAFSQPGTRFRPPNGIAPRLSRGIPRHRRI